MNGSGDHDGLHGYTVKMLADGTVLSVDTGGPERRNNFAFYEAILDQAPFMSAHVMARSEEHAIEIANAKRLTRLAKPEANDGTA